MSKSLPLTYIAPADLPAVLLLKYELKIVALYAPLAQSTAPPFIPAAFNVKLESLIVTFSQFSVPRLVKKIAPPR